MFYARIIYGFISKHSYQKLLDQIMHYFSIEWPVLRFKCHDQVLSRIPSAFDQIVQAPYVVLHVNGIISTAKVLPNEYFALGYVQQCKIRVDDPAIP